MKALLLVSLALVSAACAADESLRLDASQGYDCAAEFLERREQFPSEFPVRLLVDRRMASFNREGVFEAVDSWNEQLDTELFEIALAEEPERGPGHVVITQSHELARHTLGQTFHIEARVVKLSVEDKVRALVAKHELGHVLGLGHETDYDDLMNKVSHSAEQIDNLSVRAACLIKTALLNSR